MAEKEVRPPTNEEIIELRERIKALVSEIEEDLIEWYGKNGFGSFLEEEMIYVVDANYQHILMLQ